MRERVAEGPLTWVDVPIPLPALGATDTFALGDLELLLCNAEGTPFVVRDRCPHARSSLKGGLVRGTILECPLHGGKLDLRDGSPVGFPIRQHATCFPVRADGNGWQVGLPDFSG